MSDDRHSQLEQPIIIPDPATVQTTDIPNLYDIAQVFAGRKKVRDVARDYRSQICLKGFLKSCLRLFIPSFFNLMLGYIRHYSGEGG